MIYTGTRDISVESVSKQRKYLDRRQNSRSDFHRGTTRTSKEGRSSIDHVLGQDEHNFETLSFSNNEVSLLALLNILFLIHFNGGDIIENNNRE